MPSRINIGPENGPYVGINEENGNLQLEDNSGNVVAEWDETNAQWDFANNTLNNVDALNSDSVNTGSATIDETLTAELNQGGPDSPTRPLALGSGANLTALSSVSLSADGDDSATRLVNLSENRVLSGLMLVSGTRQSDTDYSFTDIVAVARVAAIEVIGSSERRSPGTRSYSRSGSRLEIAIDDTGETYDIGVIQLGGVDS